MIDPDAKKIQQLESTVRRLEQIVMNLAQRVDYLDRERQRLKNEITQIYGSLRHR